MPFMRPSWLMVGYLLEGSLAVVALALSWLCDLSLEQSLRWRLADGLLGVVLTVPMGLGFVLCLYVPLPPLVRIRQFSDEVLRPLFASCSLMQLALLSLLAGIGEELLFRGVIQEILSRWAGAAVGLVLASLLFGLLHPITPTYILLAGLMGLYLGIAWLLTGNLLTVIVAHALYDFGVLLYLVRARQV